MSEKSAKPVAKVGATGVSGAIATLMIWALSEYTTVEFPPEMAALLITIIGFITGYMTPDRSITNGQVGPASSPSPQEPPSDAA
jgi:hypothetical protein